MKILFLIFHGFDPDNGISKKISYQLDAFKANGHEAHICYLDESISKRRIVDKEVIANYGNGIMGKIKKRIEFGSITNYAVRNHINFVYIRSNHNANIFTIRMVKQLKKNGIKVVMEIPTYPYDQEYGSLWFKRQILQDKIFRYKFAKHLDAIVTFSDDDIIFGQRTIRISNAIDFDHVRVKETTNDTSKELNLIGVAEIHNWHGFDRVIRGLADYYSQPQTYKVYFHIVGYFFSSEIEESIRSLIRSLGVENYVILHGKKHGKELDAIFDKCDFGIGSLGRHRAGIYRMKTLKNREYAARGIPFIYSESDSDFDEKPYVLKAPANEAPININEIIKFYNDFCIDAQSIRNSIKNLSWKCQMEHVLKEAYPKPFDYNHIKLAYCIPLLDRASGMERVLTLKANFLADKLGYDVTIITTDSKGNPPFFPLSNKVSLKELDVNIDKLWNYPIWKRWFLYQKKKKEYRKKLENCLIGIKPDFCISLLRREINFISKLKDGSIKMGEIHFGRYKYREVNFKFLPNCINNWASSLWMRQLENRLKELSKFVVLTKEDVLQWKGLNNIIVIPNPITINSTKQSSCCNKQVICVGRYTYQKGIDMLIETWQHVHKMHPDWILNIYGAGDSAAYRADAEKYNLDNTILFNGAVKNITDKYLDSSIYVMSSRYEGFPLVLAEAMSVGLPCVSFACPCGPRDIIRDGEDGFLCENGNTKQLADRICRLIEDNNLRKKMGKNAARNIKRYTIDNVMLQWDNLFKEAIYQK